MAISRTPSRIRSPYVPPSSLTNRVRAAPVRKLLCGALLGAAVWVGCASPAASPAVVPVNVGISGSVDRYLPLNDQSVLAYDTRSEGSRDQGVIVLQVSRPRAGLVELNDGGHIQRIEFDPQGARFATGGYWLRLPLTQGNCWPGRTGETCITKLSRSITVPAGTFKDCVETVEQAPKTSSRTTSVFCPDVGMVSLTAEGFLDGEPVRETAVLKGYGPRVDLSAR